MQAVAGLRLRLYGVTEKDIASLLLENRRDAQLCLYGLISTGTPNRLEALCTLS